MGLRRHWTAEPPSTSGLSVPGSARADAPVRQAAQGAGLVLDPWQDRAAQRLDHLLEALRSGASGAPGRGLYLWGPVGRGKTWLLDAFFDAAPTSRKKRVHLHTLFRDLHAAVNTHRSAGRAVDAAVDELLDGCLLVCLDELHLHDVGDAMLASRLLRRLFDHGVTLVVTSNYAPEALLPDPRYHHLLEPTIDLLVRRLAVLEVAGPADYRTLARLDAGTGGFRGGALVWPGSVQQLHSLGLDRSGESPAAVPTVGSRAVEALQANGPRVWFDFTQLCERPTSTLDLLALADRFPAWVISAVPSLSGRTPEAQQRFVNLVDVAHDRDIALTLVCDVPPAHLLAGELRVPDVERAVSRLQLLRQCTGPGARPLSSSA